MDRGRSVGEALDQVEGSGKKVWNPLKVGRPKIHVKGSLVRPTIDLVAHSVTTFLAKLPPT